MDDTPFSDRPLTFPTFGVDGSRAFVRQTGETTPQGANVRAYDRLENRKRGGSRTGLARWINGAMPGAIQGLGSVVATGAQFVIGYFPFTWPSFVLDPVTFAPIRTGGSGYPSVPGIPPTLAWVPSSATLFEDEQFAVGHFDATATNPNGGAAVPGTFAYDVPVGTLFGHFDQRTVTATFTPTDPTTFRTAQAQFTFKLNKTPTKVVWTPPLGVANGTVIDGSILNATGANLATSAAVPGAVSYDIYYFDPQTGNKIIVGNGDTMNVGTVYIFKALFRPTDSVRFKEARKEAYIIVAGTTGGLILISPPQGAGGLGGVVLPCIVGIYANGSVHDGAGNGVSGTWLYAPAAGDEVAILHDDPTFEPTGYFRFNFVFTGSSGSIAQVNLKGKVVGA